jgi:site-specific DNA-adenine methylase/uncharacterized coiled-coil protein SlyX
VRYGTSYMGSKNQIAEWVVSVLPSAQNFYDLFAGGCAITHAAMLKRKYQNFIINDIGDAPKLFCDAVNGKYHNERRWISREDFQALKDNDVYIRICWSFGNNQREYLYSKEIEPWKKALHYARVFNDYSLLREMGIKGDASRLDIKAHKDEYKGEYIQWWLKQQNYTADELEALIAECKNDIKKSEEQLRQYLCEALKKSGLTAAEVDRRLGTQMSGHYFGRSQWAFPTQEYYEKMQEFLPLPQNYFEVYGLHELWQSLESLQSLQSLERLQSLQSLERLQRLQSLQSLKGDYQDVEIKDNSVIYCDIPYSDARGYGQAFDYERFFCWCKRQTQPVFISEYDMPEDRFVCIAEKQKRSLLNGQGSGKLKTEKIFVPKHQSDWYSKTETTLF